MLVFNLRILSEPTIDTESDDTKEGFREDTTAHLTCSLTSINEDNRYFFNLETNLESGVLHLDLEGIALETNHIQWDCLKNATTITYEARSRIMNMETCYNTNILAGKVTHQYTSYRPIYNVYSTDIT